MDVDAVFCFAGFLADLPVSTYRFSVLSDGSLVGTVTPVTASPTAGPLLIHDGVASIDHMQTTRYRRVYTARFSLMQMTPATAIVRECVARLSSTEDLVGRWNRVGAVGEHESSDRGFTLSQAEYLEAAEDDTESSLGDNADEDGGFLPGMFVFDGAATSNAGITFNATWTLCLHRDGTLRGESVETSVSSLPQRCPLEGTWRRHSIDVMLRLSHRHSVTYRYVGELVGKRRLTGKWKQTASDSKYAAGIFAFDLRDGDAQERQSMEQDGASASEESSRTNLPGLGELRPGEMEFRGQATAMAGYIYKNTPFVECAT
ncbi:hypothetical protein ATCC90586_011153 [Pythium insidiosum]|nr:hypothetical protein ATCC90586_011153 [Pythium insidiosum]